jgi:hypothetical protein
MKCPLNQRKIKSFNILRDSRKMADQKRTIYGTHISN